MRSIPNDPALASFAISSLPPFAPADLPPPCFKEPFVSFLRNCLLADIPLCSALSSDSIALSILLPMIGTFVRPIRLASLSGFNSFLKSLNDNDNLVDSPNTFFNSTFVLPTVSWIYASSSSEMIPFLNRPSYSLIVFSVVCC